jgi:hypothetical protein
MSRSYYSSRFNTTYTSLSDYSNSSLVLVLRSLPIVKKYINELTQKLREQLMNGNQCKCYDSIWNAIAAITAITAITRCLRLMRSIDCK